MEGKVLQTVQAPATISRKDLLVVLLVRAFRARWRGIECPSQEALDNNRAVATNLELQKIAAKHNPVPHMKSNLSLTV